MKWWIWQMISISLKCFDFFCDSFLLKITFISMCLWRPANQEGWGPWGNFCVYWPSGVAYIAELMVAALCSVILVKLLSSYSRNGSERDLTRVSLHLVDCIPRTCIKSMRIPLYIDLSSKLYVLHKYMNIDTVSVVNISKLNVSSFTA